jgi:hypothetical protein
MAKKSRSSVTGESKASAEAGTITSEKELYIPIPEPGLIDFYYLFGGMGILVGIMLIIFIVIHYIFHIL